jgi:hypothetical protein
MKNNLSTEVKSKKDFKKIYHPLRTYWLFGSEACKAYRKYKDDKAFISSKWFSESSSSYFKPSILEELALIILKEDFDIYMSTPRNKNYAMNLLDAYDGWKDYEQIDQDLYDIINKKLTL